MDTQLHSLSLADLKKTAKGRRIKHYYIMPRVELLRILSLPELPKDVVVQKLTIIQLRAEAKSKNIRGIWTMNRGELLNLLYPSLSEHQNRNSNQDEPPNNGDPNQQRT